MNQFHVGQRVVCVATGPWKATLELGYKTPVRGEVYTVREVYVDSGDEVTVGVRLVEIVNPATYYGYEVGWYAGEFRPVKTTDISIFLAMLQKTPEEVF
jgi:hypothetical protein